MRIEDVLVAGAVRNVLSTMELLVSKKAIRLEADVAAAGKVPADLCKLKQMLLNLLSNAVKFTPEGGNVTIGAQPLADTVEISVTDTGIGIAKSDPEEVFKAFRQLDSATAREQHGTELGLALTKRFIELHGGQIRIASEPGMGSVLTLVLPLTSKGANAHLLPLASSPDAARATAARSASRPYYSIIRVPRGGSPGWGPRIRSRAGCPPRSSV